MTQGHAVTKKAMEGASGSHVWCQVENQVQRYLHIWKWVSLQQVSSRKTIQFVVLVVGSSYPTHSFLYRVKFPHQSPYGSPSLPLSKTSNILTKTGRAGPWGQQIRNNGVTSNHAGPYLQPPWTKKTCHLIWQETRRSPPREQYLLLISSTHTFPTNFPPQPGSSYHLFVCNPLRLEFYKAMLVKDQPFWELLLLF